MANSQWNCLVNGKTKLLGLVGKGISYSLSPAIHNFSAALLGIDQVYVPFDLAPAELKPFIKFFHAVGGVGFNVTTPYKTDVAKLLGKKSLASANMVYRQKGKFIATSTDGQGFANALKRMGFAVKDFQSVVIIGGGGAAAALVEHFAGLPGKREVKILKRARHKSPDLNFATLPLQPAILSSLLKGRSQETILIQATSAPLQGDDLSAYVTCLDQFAGVCVDLVYGTPSALYRAAVSKGLPAQDGLPMLIEQARLSQQRWWGAAAGFEEILDNLNP